MADNTIDVLARALQITVDGLLAFRDVNAISDVNAKCCTSAISEAYAKFCDTAVCIAQKTGCNQSNQSNQPDASNQPDPSNQFNQPDASQPDADSDSSDSSDSDSDRDSDCTAGQEAASSSSHGHKFSNQLGAAGSPGRAPSLSLGADSEPTVPQYPCRSPAAVPGPPGRMSS